MVMPHAMLAVVSDAWIIGFGIFNALFSAAVSVAIWRLTAAQRRSEGMETRLIDLTSKMLDERHKTTQEQLAERHSLTTKLVDERFRAMTHEVNNHVNGFLLTVEEMKRRMQDAELDLDGLGQRDQKIELAVAAKFDELKDFLRAELAGKKDLQKHEDAVERRHVAEDLRMRDLEMRVAVISDRLGGKGTK